MTKVPAITRLHRILLWALIAVFLVGCVSRSQPEHPILVVDTAEPLPIVQDQLQQSEIVTTEPEHTSEIEVNDSILFSLGSSMVSREERRKLHAVAQRLKADHGLFITLIGHANDNGSSSFNLAVADARVQSVGAILKKLGVKSHQIKRRNVGSENLPNTCRSASCRQMMRRVELVLSTAR